MMKFPFSSGLVQDLPHLCFPMIFLKELMKETLWRFYVALQNRKRIRVWEVPEGISDLVKKLPSIDLRCPLVHSYFKSVKT